jgi:hypothetical protein
MSSLNPADLSLIVIERLIFVSPSIITFWDEQMLGINSEN